MTQTSSPPQLDSDGLLKSVRRRAGFYHLKVLVSTFAIYILQTTSVLAGIVAAALTSVSPEGYKIWIIVAASAGSAAAALLARLRLADYARARELGRIGFADALLKVQINMAGTADPKNELTELRRRIREIEYEQINLLSPKAAKEQEGNP